MHLIENVRGDVREKYNDLKNVIKTLQNNYFVMICDRKMIYIQSQLFCHDLCFFNTKLCKIICRMYSARVLPCPIDKKILISNE